MAELLALRGFRNLDDVRDWIQGTDPDEVNPLENRLFVEAASLFGE